MCCETVKVLFKDPINDSAHEKGDGQQTYDSCNSWIQFDGSCCSKIRKKRGMIP